MVNQSIRTLVTRSEMSQNCTHDHRRIETGVMSASEQVFLHKVKAGLVQMMDAYAAKDVYFHTSVRSEEIVIKKPYKKWLPWMKLVYTIPGCNDMEFIAEIYNPNEYIGDAGKDHFMIHASFTNEWVKGEAIKFMRDHGYGLTEHNHVSTAGVLSDWECGFLAFEPIN
jgi:hypothetical protein